MSARDRLIYDASPPHWTYWQSGLMVERGPGLSLGAEVGRHLRMGLAPLSESLQWVPQSMVFTRSASPCGLERQVRDVCYGYELGMWARGIGYRCRFGLRMWAGDRV